MNETPYNPNAPHVTEEIRIEQIQASGVRREYQLTDPTLDDEAMYTMMECYANNSDHCTMVPAAVSAAVGDTLTPSTEPMSEVLTPHTRAVAMAPRMAEEGWRFCDCFTNGGTQAHVLIEDLVTTAVANVHADQIVASMIAQRGEQAHAAAAGA